VSTTAVVVTFNRREHLGRCLDALAAQTVPLASTVVVDNASTDGTPEYLAAHGHLDRPGVRLERLAVNGGGAGGFSHGVALARDEDTEWIWLLDDDAEPEPDALERLLESAPAADAATACVAPLVLDAGGEVQRYHRGRWRGRPRPLALEDYEGHAPVELHYVTFVGPLIRAAAARATDPPRADFFIWAEDYEYSFRLREQGRLWLVPGAVVVHKDVGQAHSNRRSRFWNRLIAPLLGWELVPSRLDTFWRNLYGLRNYVWLKRRYEHQSALGSAAVVGQFIVRSLLCDERPLRRIPAIVRFGIAGRRGVFENPYPAEWRAR
jgi:rhamnopyranosyl-N-acetylglucosaminyl-diphospho-decaprenol beta-1,3/1,4-galactofuranosyltransferase